MKILVFIGISLGLLLVPAVAHAQIRDETKNPLHKACNNKNYTPKQLDELKKSGACGADGSQNPISGGENSVLSRIARIVATIAGIAAVIIIIIGGIGMMTSGGDSQKFSNSRNTLIFAVVGLIIVVLAQAIVTFVVNRAT